MATRVILTYDDYAAIPNDGRRYEVHEGELSVTPAPSPKHQRALLNLLVVLQQHVKSRSLGEVFVSPIDCILSNTTIVQPDIVYLATDRLSAVSHQSIEGAPTLAIEVLSPSTSQIDRVVKLQVYARHGVRHYWVVDPDARTIEAYTVAADDYQLAARLEASQRGALTPFSDLVLDPASLWA
jgi:Uma2 family endonuclease